MHRSPPSEYVVFRKAALRRWQFGIRALLVAAALISVTLGTYLYMTISFRGGQHVSTSLVDCRSSRYSLHLVNKSDELVFYHVFATLIAAVADWGPPELWDTAIPARGGIHLLADDVFAYHRRGTEVTLTTWIIERNTGQPVVKHLETVRFVP